MHKSTISFREFESGFILKINSSMKITSINVQGSCMNVEHPKHSFRSIIYNNHCKARKCYSIFVLLFLSISFFYRFCWLLCFFCNSVLLSFEQERREKWSEKKSNHRRTGFLSNAKKPYTTTCLLMYHTMCCVLYSGLHSHLVLTYTRVFCCWCDT